MSDPRDGPDDPQPTPDRTFRTPETDPPDLPFRRLGDFEILRRLTGGHMGEVYEARQLSLNRRVALKVLPLALGTTEEGRVRFDREARAAAKLHHMNIVPVYATGQEGAYYFYAMEFIEGFPLNDVIHDLREGRINSLWEETVAACSESPGIESPSSAPSPPAGGTDLPDMLAGEGRPRFEAIARLMAEVAEALDYAHSQGVIHRDIKPSNLILSRAGKLSIADFGLARLAGEPEISLKGSLIGTPAYMSPEQVAAGRMKIDHRTDVFSLGAVLYEMLTLYRPFPAATTETLIHAILTKDPSPPRKLNPKIPADLETICLKALEKDPDRRYPSAGLLAQDLRQYLSHGLISARRAGPILRSRKWVRRHPVPSIAMAALVPLAFVVMLSLQQCQARSVESARRLVAAAELDLREGTYLDGLEKINRALAAAPDLVEAQRTQAALFMGLRYERPLAQVAQALLARDSTDWQAHAWLAFTGNEGYLADIPVEEHEKAVLRLAPDTPDGLFFRGVQSESPEEALRAYDRCLEQDPSHPFALIGRLSTLRELKRFSEALAQAERLMVARPRSARGRRMASRLYDSMHDADRALSESAKALAIDPRDHLVYQDRARLYGGELGRLDDTVADLTRALELTVEVPYLQSRYLVERAWPLMDLGRHEEALADVERAEVLEPYRCWSWGRAKLEALWRLKRLDDLRAAMADLEAKAKTWSNPAVQASVYLTLSEQAQKLGEFDRALAFAARSIDHDPERLGGYVRSAWLRRREGGAAAIQDDCERIAKLELRYPDELLQRARDFYWLCEDLGGSLQEFERLMAATPEWADPYVDRGNILFSESRYAEAMADLDTAIRMGPKFARALSGRGLMLSNLEEWSRAVADFEEYFALGLEGPPVRWQYAWALAAMGREAQAFAQADTLIRRWPMNPRGYNLRSGLHFRLGRVDDAVAASEQATKIAPTAFGSYVNRLTYLWAKPGSCSRIREELEKIQKLDPQNVTVRDVEAIIRSGGTPIECPDLLDPVKALSLADALLRPDPESMSLLDTRALALLANGRLGEARDLFSRVLATQSRPDPRTLFWLAMTESKLGHPREARRAFDQAVDRMELTWPKDPGLVALRDRTIRALELP